MKSILNRLVEGDPTEDILLSLFAKAQNWTVIDQEYAWDIMQAWRDTCSALGNKTVVNRIFQLQQKWHDAMTIERGTRFYCRLDPPEEANGKDI